MTSSSVPPSSVPASSFSVPPSSVSPERRRRIVDALRRGTVPRQSLDAFAVGLESLGAAVVEELDTVAGGGAAFKAVRGDYGAGKTFFSRWLQETARRRGFAAAEVQISETETPLHRYETVYRRLIERLSTPDLDAGALRSVLEGWFYTLEEDVLAEGEVAEDDAAALASRTDELLERRLAAVTRTAPALAMALRAYRRAVASGDREQADGLLAWMSGEPTVGSSIKRPAGLKGEIDHYGALAFLQGLLVILRDSGLPGLVLVLDEVETLQRVRGDVRERGLNALRQWIDEVDAGRFPGLYLAITGTPAFYDGPQGVQRLAPLAQRLATAFPSDARFDNPRAVQVRLRAFDLERLEQVGRRIRDLYAEGRPTRERILTRADDAYVAELARAVAGELGGRIGVAPRVFLKKLVAEVLDPLDLHEDFDPRRHYALTVDAGELTVVERAARGASADVDDVDLEV